MLGHEWVGCLLVSALIQISYGVDPGPLVETKVGTIRGLRADTGDYSMYMGIPYASVDASNPFGSAIPHPSFDGIFNAFDDSAICPQVEQFNNTVAGTLNCLHLNVYVPNTATPTNKLPVLVSIYGGGFNMGSYGRYLYGPKFLIRHDIILVTLNYRVGPYGFMCLNTPDVPGNAGLKDQKFALEWIKENIDSFSGDPDKITIYGMSAGAVSVDLHFMFGNHNLFDKMIMHSGTALTPQTMTDPDVNAPIKLATHLGYQAKNTDEALKYLSTVDPLRVIESNEALGITYGLCVEQEFEGVERFVREHPYNVKALNASEKSVLLAYNRDELHLFYAFLPPSAFITMSSPFINNLETYFDLDPERLEKTETIVRQNYMGDEDFTERIRWNLGRYSSDFEFNYPTIKSVEQYVENGCQNVYHFVFSYFGDRNMLNIDGVDLVVHSDEVAYIFDVAYRTDAPSARDQLAIDRLTTLWANFVKYGNPTPQPTELLPVTWEPATQQIIPYLELSSEVLVGKRHYHDRMAFWDMFYELNGDARKGLKTNDAATFKTGILYHAMILLSFLVFIPN